MFSPDILTLVVWRSRKCSQKVQAPLICTYRTKCYKKLLRCSIDFFCSLCHTCNVSAPFLTSASALPSDSFLVSFRSSVAVTPFTIFCCTEGGGVGGKDEGGVGGLLRLFFKIKEDEVKTLNNHSCYNF